MGIPTIWIYLGAMCLLAKAQAQASQFPIHISYFLQNCKKGFALLKIADMQSGPSQTYHRFLIWMILLPVDEHLRDLQGEKNYPFILIPLG
jgi:hypothetical protein